MQRHMADICSRHWEICHLGLICSVGLIWECLLRLRNHQQLLRKLMVQLIHTLLRFSHNLACILHIQSLLVQLQRGLRHTRSLFSHCQQAFHRRSTSFVNEIQLVLHFLAAKQRNELEFCGAKHFGKQSSSPCIRTWQLDVCSFCGIGKGARAPILRASPDIF